MFASDTGDDGSPDLSWLVAGLAFLKHTELSSLTKCGYELGPVHDVKKRAGYLPLMVTLKPCSCGLRRVGAQALCWLCGIPVGISASLPRRHLERSRC